MGIVHKCSDPIFQEVKVPAEGEAGASGLNLRYMERHKYCVMLYSILATVLPIINICVINLQKGHWNLLNKKRKERQSPEGQKMKKMRRT